MKKIISLTIISAVIVTGIISSCSKEIVSRTEDAPALAPVNIDSNAGAWKPVLLTAPTDIVEIGRAHV